MKTMGMAGQLADFIEGLNFDTLPGEVVEQAKKCLLDSLGNLLAGKNSESTPKIVAIAKSHTDDPRSTIPGFGKASVEAAAFANSVMMRALDLDDGHRYAMGHPGSVLIPAALASAEACKASGREVITALTAAYEVYSRLGTVINPQSYRERGFESTGICGAVAAAALGAKLAGLDAVKTKNALGIAGLFAGGLIEYQNDGSSGKVLCPGWALSGGLRAMELARAGFTGPEWIFEGKNGFFQAFGVNPNTDHALEGLGTRHGIMDTYFKVHGCMRGLHPSVDGAIALRPHLGDSLDLLKELRVRTTPFVKRLDRPFPSTAEAAQGNLRFVLAVALKHGKVNHETLGCSLLDEKIEKIADRIAVALDDECIRYVSENPSHWGAAEVELLTSKGELFREWVPLATGEPERPLGWDGLEAKFEELVAKTDFALHSHRLVQAVRNFESPASIEEIFEIFGTAR
ncbi:MAG: MmgE/PrpD family protein [Synergistales bacterium]|jgi:2-methylcitrate dehydratase PrpD